MRRHPTVGRTVVRMHSGIARQQCVCVKTNMAEFVVFTVPSTFLYIALKSWPYRPVNTTRLIHSKTLMEPYHANVIWNGGFLPLYIIYPLFTLYLITSYIVFKSLSCYLDSRDLLTRLDHCLMES